MVLDAVLSHTGASSVYFDGPQGALTGEASPYRSWYDFEHPCAFAPYRCWWGHKSLPEVDERDPGWQRYMFGEKGGSETTAFGSAATSAIDDAAAPAHAKAPEAAAGILPAWLARGAAGYRAPTWPTSCPTMCSPGCAPASRPRDPDACVIGEVWEDPCLKVSYGELRTYGLGGSLDTVMNYALRDALLGFALGRLDAYQLAAVLKSQRLNYPAPLYGSLMNLLGSHDVERLRSVLALGRELKGCSRAEQATLVAAITPEQDARGAELQTMLVTFVYGLPGMPCVYYGDELGMQGGANPFNRQTFPCNCTARRDCGADLTGLYRKLGAMRRSSPALRGDAAGFVALDSDVLVALRPPIDGASGCTRSDKPGGEALGGPGRPPGRRQWPHRGGTGSAGSRGTEPGAGGTAGSRAEHNSHASKRRPSPGRLRKLLNGHTGHPTGRTGLPWAGTKRTFCKPRAGRRTPNPGFVSSIARKPAVLAILNYKTSNWCQI